MWPFWLPRAPGVAPFLLVAAVARGLVAARHFIGVEASLPPTSVLVAQELALGSAHCC
jgi:hypothetical protein